MSTFWERVAKIAELAKTPDEVMEFDRQETINKGNVPSVGELIGGTIELLGGQPPSVGSALRSPLAIGLPVDSEGERIEAGIPRPVLQNPFVPAGTPSSVTIIPPIDTEKKVGLGELQIKLVEDAPVPLMLAMAIGVPGPEDIPRVTRALVSKGKKLSSIGKGTKAAKFGKVGDHVTQSKSAFLRKVLGNVVPEAKNFGRSRIIASTGEIVGAPLNPLTGKKMRLTKKEMLKLRRSGGITVEGKKLFLEPGNMPKQLDEFENHIKALVKEGKNGKMWYELSGDEILNLAQGDVDDAVRMAGLLAIYSQGTGVQANATNALRAYNRFKRGEVVNKTGEILGRFGNQDEVAQAFLYKNQAWEGMKTNAFFVNLLRNIDGDLFDALKQGVTVDRWVMRGLGYNTDTPSPKQYEFAERQIAALAEKMKWEPHQAQAALWVSTKARWEASRGEAKALGLKKGWVKIEETNKGSVMVIDADKGSKEFAAKQASFLKAWRKIAGAEDVTGDPLVRAAGNFADSLKKTNAFVTSETVPAMKSNHMPGLHTAPNEVLVEYHQAKTRALLRTLDDGTEVDAIAYEFGVLRDREIDGPGFFAAENFEGTRPGSATLIATSTPPGVAQGVAKTRLKGKQPFGGALIEPVAARQLDAYATARAFLLKQEAVPWHRMFDGVGPNATVPGNGMRVQLGRTGTSDELLNMFDEFQAETNRLHAKLVKEGKKPTWKPGRAMNEAVPLYNEDGLHMVNTSFTGIPDKEFQMIAQRAMKKAFPKSKSKFIRVDGSGFQSAPWIENDWGKSPNGEGFIAAMRVLDPDGTLGYEKKLRNLQKTIGSALDEVDTSFGQKYPNSLRAGALWGEGSIVPNAPSTAGLLESLVAGGKGLPAVPGGRLR